MSTEQVVDVLLQSGALKIRQDQPFRLASGLLSPFYIDCRLILSSPAGLSAIADLMADDISRKLSADQFDVIAGGVTAGVPFATLVAERLKKPLVYIRPQPKAHGTGGQIEGGDVAGKRIVLIEDLVTRASSVQKFNAGLDAGGRVHCRSFRHCQPRRRRGAAQSAGNEFVAVIPD